MSYQTNHVAPLCAELVRKQAGITEQIMVNTWRNKIYEEDVEFDAGVFDIPCKGLFEGIDTLINARDQIEDLYQFVNNTNSPEFKSIIGEILDWRPINELTAISSKYIEEGFIRRFTKDVENLVDGKVAFTDIIKQYRDPERLDDLNLSFYSSDIPPYIKLSRLSGVNNIKTLVMSSDLARLKLVDWLITLLDCYLKPDTTYSTLKRSSFKATIKMVKTGFDKIYREMEYIRDAARLTISRESSNVTKNEIETLFAYVYKAIANIESKIIVLLYRMISANIANIRNLSEIYNRAKRLGKAAITEEFLEGYDEDDWGNSKNISLTNNALMMDAAKLLMSKAVNIYSIDKARFTNIIDTTVGSNPAFTDTNGTLVDIKFYCDVQRFTTSLVDRIHFFISQCERPVEGGFSTYSGMLISYGLLVDTDQYTEWVKKYCNPSPKYVGVPVTDIIIGDIYAFMKSLAAEANRMTSVAEICNDAVTSLRTNANGKYDWLPDIGSLIDWFISLENDVGKINVILGWMYRKRLSILSGLLPIVEPYAQTTQPVMDTGHFPLHPEDDVDVQTKYEECCAEERLARINAIYTNQYASKLSGQLYFEAEDGASQNDSDKKGSSPVVHDGGADNQQQNGGSQDSNSNKDGNTTGNNNADKKGNSGKIVDRVKSTWQKIKDIIQKLISDGTKDKNLKFLSDNRNFLISRNYTNTSVEIIPYVENTNCISLVRESITKAAGINDATLKTADEKALRNALFSNITMPQTDEGIQADLVHGFKVGKAELKVVTISDNVLKEKVQGMISFCEYYYTKFEDELNSLESEINKLSVLDGKSGSGEGDNTDKNKGLIGTYLMEAMNAARFASRDRCNDYLKILSPLASSKKKKKTDATQETDESKKG